MDNLVNQLRQEYPHFDFIEGSIHCWSPKGQQIFFSPESPAGLLHELAHARLGHDRYQSDMELICKELEAWKEAKKLAQHYGITIKQDYVEDCLDTYRDWLHKRSTCPSCRNTGVQQNHRRYLCLNCAHNWEVTAARFCRPYRRSIASVKEKAKVI